MITGFEQLLDGRDAGPFAQAPGKAAQETARITIQNMAKLSEGIRRGVSDRHPKRMTIDDLKRWHGVIFGELFKLRGGVFRAVERGSFSALIPEGGGVIEKPLFGAPADQIEAQLEATCEEWNASLDRFVAGARPEEAIRAVALLYSSICRIHPFEDGNLRAAWIALQAGLRSFDWPITHFGGRVREHDAALGPALVSAEPNACQPLTDFLLQRLSEGPPRP